MNVRNVQVADNLTVCGQLTVKGAMIVETSYERCIAENSVKTKLDEPVNVPSNMWTLVSWSTPVYDLGNRWNSMNPTRVTIKKPGVYHVEATVDWEADMVGNPSETKREIRIVRNGNLECSGDTTLGVPRAQAITHNCSCDMALSIGDYVELQVYHDSGGQQGMLGMGMNGLSHLSVQYVHSLHQNQPVIRSTATSASAASATTSNEGSKLKTSQKKQRPFTRAEIIKRRMM
jgi:hypothetical protein